ncbi:unnamed protein product [Owenia fusiformis]|uniref:Rab11 family-interacting protein 3 n=1 Tax=Owenia fusiformis TaxID=6347 RepID=A0A8S4PNM6_OWEFU|nr:unnamed protein product [Owenia fusiformis]
MEITDEYVDQLRTVFNVCDVEKKGFISVDHFVNLASEHFGDSEGNQEIKSIVTLLDQDKSGRISFEEFCSGIKHLAEKREHSTLSPRNPEGSIGSNDTLIPEEDTLSSTNETPSEVSTYNEYDTMTDEEASTLTSFVHDNLKPQQNSEDDGDSAISSKSAENSKYQNTEDTASENEEQFEDFGEANIDSDSQSGPSTNGHSKKISSSALANQLYRSGGASGHSRKPSSGSDEIFENIDDNFYQLNDKFKRLENQVVSLTENQQKNESKTSKLKDDNQFLVERVHMLEEQLTHVELKSQDRLEEEQKRNRDIMARQDREKDQEIEALTLSLKHIESEYSNLKEEAPRLKSDVDRLKREKGLLQDKLIESRQMLSTLAGEHKKLQDRCRKESTHSVQERTVNGQLLDELSRELEDLRKYKLNNEQRAHRGSSVESTGRAGELETEIQRLHAENKMLKDQNEDLNAHLLANSVVQGRALLSEEAGMSLAAEIDDLSKDEMAEALKEQKEVNQKLRQYVDRILETIIERNPSLLEITVRNANRISHVIKISGMNWYCGC